MRTQSNLSYIHLYNLEFLYLFFYSKMSKFIATYGKYAVGRLSRRIDSHTYSNTIDSSQQIMSHTSQQQGSSTVTTSPHSSHLYWFPFFVFVAALLFFPFTPLSFFIVSAPFRQCILCKCRVVYQIYQINPDLFLLHRLFGFGHRNLQQSVFEDSFYLQPVNQDRQSETSF